MISKTWMKSRLGGGLLAVCVLLGAAGQAQAACYGPQQQLPAQVVADFIANPTQLLQQYPNGGAQMISRIRDLAASNPAVLQAIAVLIAAATKDQKTAIGTGLGQAARICVGTEQAYANELQSLAAGDADVRTAYLAVTGDVAIGANGGGGGASGGAGGGQSNPLGTGGFGSSGVVNFGNGGTSTLSFSYSSSVSGGPGAPSPAVSVSP